MNFYICLSEDCKEQYFDHTQLHKHSYHSEEYVNVGSMIERINNTQLKIKGCIKQTEDELKKIEALKLETLSSLSDFKESLKRNEQLVKDLETKNISKIKDSIPLFRQFKQLEFESDIQSLQQSRKLLSSLSFQSTRYQQLGSQNISQASEYKKFYSKFYELPFQKNEVFCPQHGDIIKYLDLSKISKRRALCQQDDTSSSIRIGLDQCFSLLLQYSDQECLYASLIQTVILVKKFRNQVQIASKNLLDYLESVINSRFPPFTNNQKFLPKIRPEQQYYTLKQYDQIAEMLSTNILISDDIIRLRQYFPTEINEQNIDLILTSMKNLQSEFQALTNNISLSKYFNNNPESIRLTVELVKTDIVNGFQMSLSKVMKFGDLINWIRIKENIIHDKELKIFLNHNQFTEDQKRTFDDLNIQNGTIIQVIID